MKTAPNDLSEILADIDYRIEQIWLKLRREAVVRQAKGDRTDARAASAELAGMGETAAAIVEHVWSYVLEICRSREIRPADLVPQAATSLTYLCRALVDYASDRHEGGGDARPVRAAAGRAANAVQRHIHVTEREALLGYAGGKAVFPRAEWPDSWIKASTRKAVAAGVFLMGMMAGGIVTKAVGSLLN